MNKVLLAVIFLLLLSNISSPQDVRKVNSPNQLDSLKSAFSGKVILVNFWASWCEPCVEEFPDLIKIKNDFTDKGLRVILISLDFPEEFESKLKPFLKSNNVDFTTYFSDFKNSEELMDYFDKKWDGAMPATFIFGREGQLESGFTGKRDYNFYKKEILKLIE
jgi:thiol-disulfide isomerase/thioredoxin